MISMLCLGGLPLELLGVAARQRHLLAAVVRAVALADLRSKRDPDPKSNSLVRKDTSTHKGFHSTSATFVSY